MADTQQQQQQQHHDSSSSSPSSSRLATSGTSSPTTAPPLSRNHSHTSTDDAPATSDSEPARTHRRRPSRLSSTASSKSARRAAPVDISSPADETTAIAGRSDPRNYAATVWSSNNNHSTVREEAAAVKESFSGWLGKFGAIELENKGSVARDHLALERTFLAWLRTSLAFASIGIAITQLFRLNSAIGGNDPSDVGLTTLRHMGKPLGATFIGISILVLAIGVNRYYESQSWLMKGKFPASRGGVFLLALVAFLLMISTLVIVVVVRPSNYEL